MQDSYEKITLPNGVRIIFEKIPYLRSVSAGIWVGTGSRYEKAEHSGISHFIEHMLFKGTKTRSASELARLVDGSGGQSDAFTSKETTCYYGKTLDTNLALLLDVLCDMFFNHDFRDDTLESERGVILEEIDMYEDTPEDLAAERLFREAFRGSALARPILGSPSALAKMTPDTLNKHMEEHYLGGSTVVALSGSFDRANIDWLCEKFAAMKPGREKKPRKASYTPTFTAKAKPIEQNHICVAFPSVSFRDKERYAVQLLSNILGGGMSSRLFQKLREELGLCYSVYTFSSSHEDTGLFGISTALGADTEETALSAIAGEVKRLLDDGVTDEELSRAREQVKSGVIMSLESSSARMNRLARGELLFGEIVPAEELIERYNAVTREDILAAARRVFTAPASLSCVGKVRSPEEYRSLFPL